MKQDTPKPPVVLASSSPYRKALLGRLGIPFIAAAPAIDETPSPGETPDALVLRLAGAKAMALRERFPQALIIGSDQVAVVDGDILGKPRDYARAEKQLLRASGRRVDFLTGVCVLNAATGQVESACVPYSVCFRELKPAEIRAYLERERPFDCAGSFKSEGLGVALFEKMEGEDPTALVGLPLIRLARMLAKQGLDVLLDAAPSA